MQLWTVQRTEDVAKAFKDGLFQPDFSESYYIKHNDVNPEDFKVLYQWVLNSFNRFNGTQVPGVIFAFAPGEFSKKENTTEIYQTEGLRDLLEFIKMHENQLKSLWNTFWKRNVEGGKHSQMCIVELDVDIENLDLRWIEYNNFSYVIPPFMPMPPFPIGFEEKIIKSLLASTSILPSPLPSGIYQAHLPNLKKQEIKNVYNMVNLFDWKGK